MNNSDQSSVSSFLHEPSAKDKLREQIKNAVDKENLTGQRELITAIARDLNLDTLNCAAAILFNYINISAPDQSQSLESVVVPARIQPAIKLVRYRLDLGSQHQVSLAELKKILVEESGVDINNIANVRIQDSYTLIDLPDEMPQEIYHHLKSIEVNGQKLDIRRVKARNKKRGNRRHRHFRSNNTTNLKEASSQ